MPSALVDGRRDGSGLRAPTAHPRHEPRGGRRLSKFVSDVAATVVCRALVMSAGLVTAIATSRFLGPEGRGAYYLAITWAALASQFGSLGGSAGVVWLRRHHGASLGDLLGTTAFQALVAGSVAAVATLAVAALLGMSAAGNFDIWLAVVLAAVGGLFFQLVASLIIADSRTGLYNATLIINSALAASLVSFAAWKFGRPAPTVYAAGGASVLAAIFAASMTGRREVTRWRVNLALMKRGAGFSARIFLTTLLCFVAQKISVFVLAKLAVPEQVGYFSVAAQVCDALLAVPASIGVLLFPQLVATGAPDWHRTRRTMVWTTGIMLLVVVAVALTAHDVLLAVIGGRFDAAAGVTRHLLPSVIFLSTSTILSQYIAAAGAPIRAAIPWAVAAVIGASWCAVVAPSRGAEGAADSQTVANAFALLGLWMVARRIRRTPRMSPCVAGTIND